MRLRGGIRTQMLRHIGAHDLDGVRDLLTRYGPGGRLALHVRDKDIAVHAAIRAGCPPEMFHLLLDHGASPNARLRTGERTYWAGRTRGEDRALTALRLARECNHQGAVAVLLARGAGIASAHGHGGAPARSPDTGSSASPEQGHRGNPARQPATGLDI